jgi:hypothetical protein
LPEAMLLLHTWQQANKTINILPKGLLVFSCQNFQKIVSKLFQNKGWSHKGDNLDKIVIGGEQPIDVSSTPFETLKKEIL